MSQSDGFVVWLTGLSGAGKSTLATRLAEHLKSAGIETEVLDGDEVRGHLSQGLGFSRADRNANIARIAYVARLLAAHGVAVIVAAISPYADAREEARRSVDRFVEVHVDCSLDELTRRDPKGLYERALRGQIANFTGVSDPYESPASPEVRVNSERQTVQESLDDIVAYLQRSGLAPATKGRPPTTPLTVSVPLRELRPPTHRQHQFEHLDLLEAEAVYIFREVAAECERPALLFSGGKDSAVMLRVAEKAFLPAKIPFPVVHVDTGHNFPEVIDFRDRRAGELGVRLLIGSVQEAIDAGRVIDETGPRATRNRLQTEVLLETIRRYRFDALFGGGRRDEEKARAKERVFSFRDEFGQWDPKRQRPELWDLYNARKRSGEHLRVFPISNWTELDVWQYIAREEIDLPSIYRAHRRPVVRRDGMLMPVSDYLVLLEGEAPFEATVRFRTVGDMTCTAAVESQAECLDDVIAEIAATRVTERGETRADDRFSETAMEDRKRLGYF